MSNYTQGVCHDGAAILKDGQPLTIEQILDALRERDSLANKNAGLIQQCEIAERQRDEHLSKLRSLNHGDYSEAWHWMGDGNDHPESLCCPVLISAEDLNSIIAERDAALGREAALATHVEAAASIVREYEKPGLVPSSKWLARKMTEWAADQPTTNLARRDALKEAEAVEKWADCLESIIRRVEAEHSKDPNYPAIGAEGMGEFAADMRTEAENLRKQAEGLK